MELTLNIKIFHPYIDIAHFSHAKCILKFGFEEQIYTRFYQQNESSETHKNKSLIRGQSSSIPDGAMTMDEDCDLG